MLRFAEEILLLALDDETGRLLPLPDRALDFALAGAVLAELLFRGKLRIEEERVVRVQTAPPKDPVLREGLALIPGKEEGTPLQEILTRLAGHGSHFRDNTFQTLEEKGILRCKDDRFLWVFHLRRYPILDDREEKEVRRRIRDVILREENPGPRDVILVALMDVCQLSYTVFTEEELERVGERIHHVARMDFLGRAMAQAINQIQQAILQIRAYSGI